MPPRSVSRSKSHGAVIVESRGGGIAGHQSEGATTLNFGSGSSVPGWPAAIFESPDNGPKREHIGLRCRRPWSRNHRRPNLLALNGAIHGRRRGVGGFRLLLAATGWVERVVWGIGTWND